MAEITNNNQALIDGLRQAADFLESHPGFPDMTAGFAGSRLPLHLRLWVHDKTELGPIARELGSFTKQFNDNHFELHKAFGPSLDIEVTISREQVCKKIVTWDCPDDESLLKLVESPGVAL